MATDKKDMVNSPAHYMQGSNETIVEMVYMFGFDTVADYCKCAAWKYRARAPFKGNAEEDFKKADWYISAIDILEAHDILELKRWLWRREKEGVKNGTPE